MKWTGHSDYKAMAKKARKMGDTKKSALQTPARHFLVEVSGLEPKVKPLPENLDLLISIAYICRWS